MQDFTGKTIGGCRIIKKIGEGGMGVIYEAEQLSLNRPVAVKFLAHHLAHSEKSVSRFLREARSAASLSHPHVLQVINTGEEEGALYIITELVSGKTLREIINEKGAFPEEEALKIISDIASALTAAEEKNMVHRDLKPDNVMITNKGQVKVMDFGLAKNIESATECVTNPGAAIGTPNYMSPEQVKGEAVDIRSDIYSLGLVFFFLVTGESAYKGTGVSAFNQQINMPLPDPFALKPDISEKCRLLINKMCNKNPDMRFQSPKDILRSIAVKDKDPVAFAQTVVDQPVKLRWIDRIKGKRLSLAAVILIITLSLTSVMLFFNPHKKTRLSPQSASRTETHQEYIQKGENLMNENKWDDAILTFQKATKEYPEETGTEMWINMAKQKRDRELVRLVSGELVTPGQLTVLVSDYPPFYSRNEKGEENGFDVELTRRFAEKMKIAPHYEMVVQYKDLVDELAAKKGDIISAGMTITDSRQKIIDFSCPYLSNTEVLITRDGMLVKSTQDLEKKNIGYVPGTTYEKTAKMISGGIPKAYNSEEEMVSALKNNEIDAYIEDLGSALLTTKMNPELDIAFTFKTLEYLGAGIRKDTPHLKKAMDAFIRDAEESGLLKKLFQKYFVD